MKSWWQIDGAWPKDNEQSYALVGTALANRLQIHKGDSLTFKDKDNQEQSLYVAGILSSGGEEDNKVITQLSTAQDILGLQGKIDNITVSAITTPENELARRASKNPKSLSMKEYEVWYCTAYVSSIAYQIEEVVQGSVARPVRQIAESEGKILDKTQMLMVLITALSLLSATMGVSNLVSANVMERSKELGLLKALGATDLSVVMLVLTEIFIAGIIGGIVGYIAGIGFAQFIGQAVFGSAIAINWMVVPLLVVLLVFMLLIGSLPAIKSLLKLRPGIVLHGR